MADGKLVSSTKGWNWGAYQLGQDQMSFTVNGQPCFLINYKDIALTNASGKNEVALEFNQGADGKR
jgi:structure-specific recognition protein 1